jgi:hypothetical protein
VKARRNECSLARAGTPVGVLLRRELLRRGVDAVHYSISIIRGRGIDRVALAHLAAARGTEDAVFVDGWTGKGAIVDNALYSVGTFLNSDLVLRT